MRFLVPLVIIVVLGFFFRRDAYRPLADGLAAPLAHETRRKVIVLPLSSLGGRDAEQGREISANLVHRLVKTGLVDVAEFSLKQHARHRTPVAAEARLADSPQRRLGRSLGADVVVVGSFQPINEKKVRVNVRSIDVETGAILSATSGVVPNPFLSGAPPDTVQAVGSPIGRSPRTSSPAPPRSLRDTRTMRSGARTVPSDEALHRWGAAAGVMWGKLYLFGGVIPGGKVSHSLMEYDTRDAQWTAYPAKYHGRTGASVAVVRDTLYVIAGCKTTSTTSIVGVVESFDAGSHQWDYVIPLLKARTGVAAAAVHGRVYIIGGEAAGVSHSLVDVIRYGTRSNQNRNRMPTPRHNLGAAVIGGRVYAVGGERHGGYDFVGDLEIYDPRTDSWTIGAPLPMPVSRAGVAAVRGKLYVLGGLSGDGVHRSVFEYEPERDRWRERSPMPTPRWAAGTAVLDGNIYVVGGALDPSGTIAGVMEVYDPARDSWRSL